MACGIGYTKVKFEHTPYTLPQLKTKDIKGKRHYITPEGEHYPSVTTILDTLEKPQGLKDWIERVGEEQANKIMNASARKGTDVHLVCERYLNNEVLPHYGMMPDITGIWFKMRPALDKIHPVCVLEQSLYSKKYRFAGKTDCIGSYDTIPSVVDFKTSRTPLQNTPEKIKHYGLQLAAYSIAWEEQTGQSINQGVLIAGSIEHGCKVFKMALRGLKKRFLTILDKYYTLETNSDEGI